MEPEKIKTELDINEIKLSGIVETLDGEFENQSGKFNKALIRVERLSGNADYIPIVYKSTKIKLNLLDKVKIVGNIRTRNEYSEELGRNKVILYVFVKDIQFNEDTEATDENEFTLSGYICKPVVYRETPKGIKISDIFIAYNSTFNRSFYIPAIAFSKLADYAKTLSVGDKITITGRFQSRDYIKKISDDVVLQKTAYELAIMDFINKN